MTNDERRELVDRARVMAANGFVPTAADLGRFADALAEMLSEEREGRCTCGRCRAVTTSGQVVWAGLDSDGDYCPRCGDYCCCDGIARRIMRAVAYTRVSTQEQADSGLSLTGQRERIAAYCTARGWTLVETVTDAGVSGGTLDRPGLRHVLDLVRRHEVEVVCVLKLDRLTRSVKDLGTLLETFDRARVDFSSVTDNFDTSNANGRLVLNVLASVAQWERDIIAERTSDAMQVAKRQGRRVGAVPFGFTLGQDGTTLDPDPAALETVADIADRRRNGESLRRIAGALNAAGVLTAQAKTWTAETVRRVLHNDLYALHVDGFTPETRRREAVAA